MEEYQQMLDDCLNREERLSEWEQGFLDSISHVLGAGRHLSDRQIEVLEKIWEKATKNG